MKILADESVDFPIINFLRLEGYDVLAIIETNAGISDDEVMKIAIETNRFLITADKDFGEITFRTGQIGSGILLLRLIGITNPEKCLLVLEAIKNHKDELLNSFSVLTDKQIRIRKI